MSTAAATAARGASLLVALVVGQRLLSFALNQTLLRHTTPAVFGVVANTLELLKDTALFFGREGLRLALLRVPMLGARDVQGIARLINVAWLAAPLTAVCAFALATLALRSTPDVATDAYATAVTVYVVAIAVEAVCEPAYVLAQNQMGFGVRVAAEAMALVARAAVAVVLVVHGGQDLLGFAWAQLAYAVVYALVYYGHFARQASGVLTSARQLVPHRPAGLASWLDAPTLSLAFTFTRQSVLKHLLTEGDRLLLLQSSFVDQGVYGAAANLGSIAVRVIFQPVEETSRVLFAKLTAGPQAQVQSARSLLITVCKLVTIVGLTFACFGSNYTHLLVYVLQGARWAATSAPAVLAAYCVYVALLAVNGITEAFVYAVASEAQVGQINYSLIAFSAVHAAAGTLGVQHNGTLGLVHANALNMLLRVAYSLRFISQYFAEQRLPTGITDLLPRWPVLAAYAASLALLQTLAHGFVDPAVFARPLDADVWRSTTLYVGCGGVLALCSAVTILMTEPALLQETKRMLRLRRTEQKER